MHFTELSYEANYEIDYIESKVPAELSIALEKISKSPIGIVIYNKSLELQKKFKFIEVTKKTDPDYAVAYRVGFDDQGPNAIHYTVDLAGWKLKTLEGKPEKVGEEISSSTIGSIIAHELGHTEIGLKAFNKDHIPLETYQQIVKSEVSAIKYYENIYRKFYRMPLRKTYFKENDVLKSFQRLFGHFYGRINFELSLPYSAL